MAEGAVQTEIFVQGWKELFSTFCSPIQWETTVLETGQENHGETTTLTGSIMKRQKADRPAKEKVFEAEWHHAITQDTH